MSGFLGPSQLGNRQTKTDSHYRRLTRFFNDKTAQYKLWKWLIVWMLNYIKRWDGHSRSVYLTLDGTNWQLGSHQIHLLMLCLVYRGVSLPLLWYDLGKKGHSSQHEPLRLREAVFRKGYSLVVNELVSVAHFVDWLLVQLTKPLKVPIRIFFFNVQH